MASLEDLPEELVLELFDAVLRRGKLQPRVLALFEVRPAPHSAPPPHRCLHASARTGAAAGNTAHPPSATGLTKGLPLACQGTQHDLLLARVRALNLQPLPPVLPLTRNAWLGEKPNWY